MNASLELSVDRARSAIDTFAQGDFENVSRPGATISMLVDRVNRHTGYESFQFSKSTIII